jgi:hypothetical protein
VVLSRYQISMMATQGKVARYDASRMAQARSIPCSFKPRLCNCKVCLGCRRGANPGPSSRIQRPLGKRTLPLDETVAEADIANHESTTTPARACAGFVVWGRERQPRPDWLRMPQRGVHGAGRVLAGQPRSGDRCATHLRGVQVPRARPWSCPERYPSGHPRKTYAAQFRFAACVTDTTWTEGDTRSGHCRMVAQINGQCYTNDEIGWFFTANAHDCALTDREIVSPSNQPIDAEAGDATGG